MVMRRQVENVVYAQRHGRGAEVRFTARQNLVNSEFVIGPSLPTVARGDAGFGEVWVPLDLPEDRSYEVFDCSVVNAETHALTGGGDESWKFVALSNIASAAAATGAGGGRALYIRGYQSTEGSAPSAVTAEALSCMATSARSRGVMPGLIPSS